MVTGRNANGFSSSSIHPSKRRNTQRVIVTVAVMALQPTSFFYQKNNRSRKKVSKTVYLPLFRIFSMQSGKNVYTKRERVECTSTTTVFSYKPSIFHPPSSKASKQTSNIVIMTKTLFHPYSHSIKK